MALLNASTRTVIQAKSVCWQVVVITDGIEIWYLLYSVVGKDPCSGVSPDSSGCVDWGCRQHSTTLPGKSPQIYLVWNTWVTMKVIEVVIESTYTCRDGWFLLSHAWGNWIDSSGKCMDLTEIDKSISTWQVYVRGGQEEFYSLLVLCDKCLNFKNQPSLACTPVQF